MSGFVDKSSACQCQEVKYMDSVPVYVKELIAGGTAGAFAKTAVAPLERIKILLQTRTTGFRSLGIYPSLKKLLKHEGVSGLYKGNGASVLRIVPYAALHFMTYEHYQSSILNNYSALGTGPIVDLVAGSAAGGTAVLCTYPLDLARTKLAYQVTDTQEILHWGTGSFHSRPKYSGIKNVMQAVYKGGGARGLYRGIGPTLIGILPYAGLKFYIYEELKRHVPEEHQKSILMRLMWSSSRFIWTDFHVSTRCCPKTNAGRASASFITRWCPIQKHHREAYAHCPQSRLETIVCWRQH